MASEWANGGSSAESQDPGGSEAELRELEDELCRLGGVLAVRVVGDRNGRPIEVHVLADQSKPAKQTVRDVRAVAQTMFGLELDHRIVSVAQLDSAAEQHRRQRLGDPRAPGPGRSRQLRGSGRARRRPRGRSSTATSSTPATPRAPSPRSPDPNWSRSQPSTQSASPTPPRRRSTS